MSGVVGDGGRVELPGRDRGDPDGRDGHADTAEPLSSRVPRFAARGPLVGGRWLRSYVASGTAGSGATRRRRGRRPGGGARRPPGPPRRRRRPGLHIEPTIREPTPRACEPAEGRVRPPHLASLTLTMSARGVEHGSQVSQAEDRLIHHHQRGDPARTVASPPRSRAPAGLLHQLDVDAASTRARTAATACLTSSLGWRQCGSTARADCSRTRGRPRGRPPGRADLDLEDVEALAAAFPRGGGQLTGRAAPHGDVGADRVSSRPAAEQAGRETSRRRAARSCRATSTRPWRRDCRPPRRQGAGSSTSSSTHRPRTTSASGRHDACLVRRATRRSSARPGGPRRPADALGVATRRPSTGGLVRRSAVTNGVWSGVASRWQRISVMLIEIRVGPSSPRDGWEAEEVSIPGGYDEATRRPSGSPT